MADLRCVHVRISGRVQGVSFRAWTERRATSLGLSGWVRNLANGDVEAVFSGPAEDVEAMVAECRQGPRLARIEHVQILGDLEPVSGPFGIRADG